MMPGCVLARRGAYTCKKIGSIPKLIEERVYCSTNEVAHFETGAKFFISLCLLPDKGLEYSRIKVWKSFVPLIVVNVCRIFCREYTASVPSKSSL
jgi:hypothetical protein